MYFHNIFMFNRTRQENKAKGLAFLRAGNRQQAQECFQKCVDITPEMALEVIRVCCFVRCQVVSCELTDVRYSTCTMRLIFLKRANLFTF